MKIIAVIVDRHLIGVNELMSWRRCMNIIMILGAIVADMIFALTSLPIIGMLRDALVIITLVQHARIAYLVHNIQEIDWE